MLCEKDDGENDSLRIFLRVFYTGTSLESHLLMYNCRKCGKKEKYEG